MLEGEGQNVYRVTTPAEVSSAVADRPIHERILLEGGPSLVLYLPENAVLVRTDLAYPAADRYGLLYHLQRGQCLEYSLLGERARPPGLVSREAVSTCFGGTSSMQGHLRNAPDAYVTVADMLEDCLEVPDALSPGIASLARQLTRNCPDDAARAEAILRFFHQSFHYGLDYTPPKGTEPVEDFILNRRTAHCELFASGMALMLREVKVPTRYVVGFMPREHREDPAGGYYVVRESDAHAWCEVYLKGRGWCCYDPTPPGEGLRPLPELGRLDRLNEALDLLSTRASAWFSEGGVRVLSAAAAPAFAALLVLGAWFLMVATLAGFGKLGKLCGAELVNWPYLAPGHHQAARFAVCAQLLRKRARPGATPAVMWLPAH